MVNEPAASQPNTGTNSCRAAPFVRVAALAIVLLAFALRAAGLLGQSLWSDEGISINRSLLPFGEMLAGMPVEHAPGYFVLLGVWLRALANAAETPAVFEYGLRYFSLLPGVLAVALLMRLGNELARPAKAAAALALVAGLLAAVNPTQQWYAQEGRMYTWLLAASVLSTWALWRLLHGAGAHRWRYGALYAVATALCVYLHYYGALTPIAHALYVPIWGIATQRWRRVFNWLIAAGAAFLLFVPWLPRAVDIFGFTGWREEGVVSEIPLTFARLYLVGYIQPDLAIPTLILFLIVALVGTAWWMVRRVEAALLLLLWIAVPFTTVILLALRNPDFHPRYTLYVSAPLLLLLAGGVVATSPRAWGTLGNASRRPAVWLATPLVVLTVLATANSAAIFRQQNEPNLAKPDFRAAVQRVLSEEGSGDVILVDGPDPELVIERYYTGALPLHDLRELADASGDEIDAALRADTAGATRFWEILYFHDPAAVQVWTATQAFSTAPTIHRGIRVTLYGMEVPGLATTPMNLSVGEALELTTATVQTQVAVGDIVRVRTDWFTHAQAPELRFSLRMVDAAGTLVVSDDYVPQNWFAPTNVWVVGASARDQRALIVPEETAPGEYTVTLRLYDPATGMPETTTLGEDIPLGAVEVIP